MPKNLYLQFLLLIVGCRILNNNRMLMATNIHRADSLLRRFFQLLLSLYGPNSQVLSIYNLMRVADDARAL